MELASRADCGDREDERVQDMFTTHMNNDKIAEELLAQTRSPQDAYEYAIRREKGIEHSRTMKTNRFGGHQIAPKQEPINYKTRGVAVTTLTLQTYKEGEALEEDRFHAGHKTPEDNKELQTQVVKNSVKNAEISIIKTIYIPARKDKICAKCAKWGHFAKLCRSTQVNYLEDTQIDQQQELETESLETENDPVAFAVFFQATVGTINK